MVEPHERSLMIVRAEENKEANIARNIENIARVLEASVA
jgi:hypothetical protein